MHPMQRFGDKKISFNDRQQICKKIIKINKNPIHQPCVTCCHIYGCIYEEIIWKLCLLSENDQNIETKELV